LLSERIDKPSLLLELLLLLLHLLLVNLLRVENIEGLIFINSWLLLIQLLLLLETRILAVHVH